MVGDLRFYVLFNSILVISGRWEVDNERLCAMEFRLRLRWLAGWMTCDFTSFLTVFQSYQDDVWMVMKGYVQWNSVNG